MSTDTETPHACYCCSGPTGEGAVRLRVQTTTPVGVAEGDILTYTRRTIWGLFCAECIKHKAPADPIVRSKWAKELGAAKRAMTVPVVVAAAEPDSDDYPPSSDDLEALGFEFDDEDVMFLYCGAGRTGPQVVVRLHGNPRSDDYMTARSLGLYWALGSPPRTHSGSLGIRDNPTLRQIKTLVDALKGE